MDKIKEQANTVGQLVFSSETGDLYKKTLTRTWDIIRETGLLLWLVVCLTVVGGEWFYRTSVGLGRSARDWYTTFSEKSTATTETQPLGSTGEALLGIVKSSTSNLIGQARKQIGLPDPEPTAPVAAPSKPTTPPVSAAPATPPAAPAASTPAATPSTPPAAPVAAPSKPTTPPVSAAPATPPAAPAASTPAATPSTPPASSASGFGTSTPTSSSADFDDDDMM